MNPIPPTASAKSTRRILVVSAGFDPKLNEMSAVWQRLADSRDVEICVIAPGNDRLKGNRVAMGSQQLGRLTIHWLHHSFPLAADPSVAALADAFRPDTVFAGPRDHLRCALDLARRTGAEVALHVEYFFDDRHLLRRREYAGVTPLRSWVGRRVRRSVLRRVQTVFVSDPCERSRFGDDPRLHYLPWPHPSSAPSAGSPRDDGLVEQRDRRIDELLYIGSLFRAKGATRLASYFCAAARALPDLSIRIIGPAIDRDGEQALARIQEAAGARFAWLPSVPRDEALARIGRSFCAVSPGDSHGWGQIGDAWHLHTAVIAAREHYDLRADRNCLIALDEEAFVAAVRSLRVDLALRERLVTGGAASVDAHDVEAAVQAMADGLKIPS